jgi:hypothetical protein
LLCCPQRCTGSLLSENAQTSVGPVGAPPVEIYSEWSIQDGGQTLYEHKLTPPDPVAIDQLPTNTIIEFRAYNDGKGYASAMGYHDIGPAQRPGYCRMRRDIGKVADAPCPQDFSYEIVQ